MSDIKQINIDETTYDIKDETARLGKLDNSNVTVIQTTLAASKAYNQNDPFIYNGQLYKADSAIASGGTIVISGTGQNASATTIEALINLHSGGGSVGHTILDDSGSAMNQRGKLQFDGLNVSDDSGNDKTVVTAPTPDYVDEQFDSSKQYSKGMTCIEGNVRYRYKNSTATSGHRPPNTTYWEVLSVADELAVTNINNGSVEGISYVKHGKMRMLTVGTGANRTITDLTNFISQNITADDLPKNTTGSTFQILTISSGSWSMEIGQMIMYAKTSMGASSQYSLYKSGSLMPKTSNLSVGGQIVWFVE